MLSVPGIISYTEYLFLLSVLTSKYTLLRVDVRNIIAKSEYCHRSRVILSLISGCNVSFIQVKSLSSANQGHAIPYGGKVLYS